MRSSSPSGRMTSHRQASDSHATTSRVASSRGISTSKVLDRSPFETLDTPGVGQMVRMGAWLGRKTRPDLKLGVCGEHGGDPDSIDFFHHSGIDYVSCSPYRVPVARDAA